MQAAVGMSEVELKKADIEHKPHKECDKLRGDPIRVVSGPGGDLFITDHHHTAYAWLLVEQERHESPTNGICRIVNAEKGLSPVFETEEQFSTELEAKHLVRRPPQSLAALADDPYRSLAWLVRDRGGFCRTELEFAEFAWADFFRRIWAWPSGTRTSWPRIPVTRSSTQPLSLPTRRRPGRKISLDTGPTRARTMRAKAADSETAARTRINPPP